MQPHLGRSETAGQAARDGAKDAAKDLLRRRRDKGRNMAFLGFGLTFIGSIVGNFGNITLFQGRQIDLVAIAGFAQFLLGYGMMAGGFVLFAAGGMLWAMYALRLHRAHDPWAYDPDIDGPDPSKRHELDDSYKAGDAGRDGEA